MLAAALLMYLYLLVAGRFTLFESGYCCARAFLLAEFAASLEWQLHTYLEYIGIRSWWTALLLLVSVYAIVFILSFHLERQVLRREYLAEFSWRELVTVAGIAIVVFLFSNMSFVMTNTPFTTEIRADIFNTRTLVDAVGLAVMYAFQSRLCEYMAKTETSTIQTMLKNQYGQYRNYNDSMELIQIKYHDLKHQIAGLRAETDVEKRKEWIDAMERELDATQMMEKTGSPVLDTLLSSRLTQAKKNQVHITYVVDGALLNFIHVTDLCAIFGNALDNAMESVILISDPEKRLIHLSVSARKNFLLIQVSNYCEHEVKMVDGQMPQTTKADAKNHGYGLKSIRYSVEKYDGSVAVETKDHWFELRILIPMKAG
jgi:signal transduction histidine kinase